MDTFTFGAVAVLEEGKPSPLSIRSELRLLVSGSTLMIGVLKSNRVVWVTPESSTAVITN